MTRLNWNVTEMKKWTFYSHFPQGRSTLTLLLIDPLISRTMNLDSRAVSLSRLIHNNDRVVVRLRIHT